MLAICPRCRQANGVRCPQCGANAAVSQEGTPIRERPQKQSQPAQQPLYVCKTPACYRHTRPFHAAQGGITHRNHAHGRCPPTQAMQQEKKGSHHTPHKSAPQRGPDGGDK